MRKIGVPLAAAVLSAGMALAVTPVVAAAAAPAAHAQVTHTAHVADGNGGRMLYHA